MEQELLTSYGLIVMEEFVGKLIGIIILAVLAIYAFLFAVGVAAIIFAFLTLFVVKANRNLIYYEEFWPTILIALVFSISASGLISLGSIALLIAGNLFSIFQLTENQMEMQAYYIMGAGTDFSVELFVGFFTAIIIRQIGSITAAFFSFPIAILAMDFVKRIQAGPNSLELLWLEEDFRDWANRIFNFDLNFVQSMFDFENWMSFTRELIIGSNGNIFELEPLIISLVAVFTFLRWLFIKSDKSKTTATISQEIYKEFNVSIIVFMISLAIAVVLVPALWRVGGIVSFIGFIVGAFAWITTICAGLFVILLSFMLSLVAEDKVELEQS